MPANGERRYDWLARILIPLLFFAASAPTLHWTEFAGGAENIVVATALEMRRSGHWLIPTLAGEKRLAKPPLAAWIAALSIDRTTFDRTLADNPADWESAYRKLAFEVRLAALLCACIALSLTYDLGRILANRQIGLIAALAHGASYAFFRYGRIATTDVQLALWVTAANLFLAKGVFENKRYLAAIGGGAALALAFISKGPVALVQTILPFALFTILWKRDNPSPARRLLPIVIGTVVFTALAIPWFLYVAARTNAWSTWYIEIFRKDPLVPRSSPFNYFILFALILPWSAFLIAGLIHTITLLRQRPISRITLALFLLLVPILIMTFFRDRKERYLLPMLPAAAILAAWGLVVARSEFARRRPGAELVLVAHFILLALLALGIPIAGATGKVAGMTTTRGYPWFTGPLTLAVCLVCSKLIIISIRYRYGIWAIIAPTVIIMLLLNPLLLWGYSRSENGRSDMKDFAFQLRHRFPDTPAYSHRPGRRPPEELSIYMNRTVVALPSLDKLPAPTTAQLLFIFENKSESLPSLPPYWTPIDTYPRGEGTWHVYHHP